MRRLLGTGLLLLVSLGLLVGAKASDTGTPTYRVDAVFDRTAALIPGQKVKIAGAPVGEVSDITLTSDRHARVEMNVKTGFAPFRTDARCTIRAEALIGEKFVQCDPGTPGGRQLDGRDGHPPTVPLKRNSVPVEIDTILSTFRRPYRERLRILLNELGIGLAGRSDDLNDVIRRANPALRDANSLLRVVDRERVSLGKLVDGTDAAVAELAAHRGAVQDTITRANAVTQATASRRDDLSETIRRLPPLLAEAKPSADRLAAFAREATPAARQLRDAAPAVNTLLGDVEPLTKATVPALKRLNTTARVGRRAVRHALPVADKLASAAHELPDVVKLANKLVYSLKDQGAIENLLAQVFYTTTATNRFDAISHMFPAFLMGNDCNIYQHIRTAGCNGHFSGTNLAPAAATTAKRRRGARREAVPQQREAPAAPRTPAPRPTAPKARKPAKPNPLLPLLPLPRPKKGGGIELPRTGIPLLDYLLR